MKFSRAGVQDVQGVLRLLLGAVLWKSIPLQGAGTGSVVDGDAGLVIIDIDVEADALALVLHRLGLHLHAPGHQLSALKDGSDPVEDVVAGLLDVIRHHVFKGEHPLHVEIAGAGDEVLLIGILTAELIADEMAAVVQVLAIHDVIFHRLPAAGLDLADAVPFLRGHQVQTDVGIGGAAPAKQIQAAVSLERVGGEVLLGKAGLVVLEHHIGLAGEGRDVLQREGGGRGLKELAAAGQRRAEQQEEGDEMERTYFHGR